MFVGQLVDRHAMSMIFDNTESNNPFKAINEVHDAFRKKIRNHCSVHIIKLRWIKGLTFEQAYNEYASLIQTNKIDDNWLRLLKKTQKEIDEEFSHVCDEWMLKAVGSFDLPREIKDSFQVEWDIIGPKPSGLL